MTNNCCGQCLGYRTHPVGKKYCKNPNCECHTKEKIIAGAKDFAERFEGVMKELKEKENPEPSTWRERFRESFAEDLYTCTTDKKILSEIMNFIEKTIADVREEERNKALEWAAGCVRGGNEEVIKRRILSGKVRKWE